MKLELGGSARSPVHPFLVFQTKISISECLYINKERDVPEDWYFHLFPVIS